MKKLFVLASLLVIASMALAACGGSSTPVQATPTQSLWDRPAIIIPPNYVAGVTKFVGYLDPGFWYNDGQVFMYQSGRTPTDVTVTICYVENYRLYGANAACSDQTLSLNYKDFEHSFLDGINFQHPVWLMTDGKNIEVWSLSGINHISAKPEDIAQYLGTPAAPTALATDPELLPAMISGLTHDLLVDQKVYQVCPTDECDMTKWDKATDSFTRLKWDDIEDNYTYIPGWMPWSDDLLIYGMLNELEINPGNWYSVCSNPGNAVWLDGKLLEGCIMGLYVGLSHDQLYYEFIDNEGDTWQFSYWPGAFYLVRPINVH